MKKRKLPIGGVQNFSILRKEYDVYVDKTMRIYEMAQARRFQTVFLSRPRRFGKSLLCSTIEYLFRGERELFKGLAVDKSDWQWIEHPVIHLKLGEGNYTIAGKNVLLNTLNEQLNSICLQYDIPLVEIDVISVKFIRIIKKLFEKLGAVVVIVDEYDYPLLSVIDQPELNLRLREELKGFYAVLKQNEEYLRFSFITGVTKFTQVSLFSGMNQPKDISMMQDFYDICGITQDELEEYFTPEIEEYAQKHGGIQNYLNKLKEYYNGYNFTKKKQPVYNTYGLLNHFTDSAEFTPYWSLSGIPSFTLKYLEAKVIDITRIENARMSAGRFGDYRDNTISLFPLLYQAGYLTITDYDENTGLYQLDYPNLEVRKNFAEFLADNYSKAGDIYEESVYSRFVKALLDGKIDNFINLLKIFLQKVDYSISSKITEYYFEFAVSNIINMLGLVCVNEVHTANGRMDSVIFAGDYIYILEFKIDKPVEDALWQIEEKDYAMIYADSGKKLVKTGIIFNREARNIIDWKVS
jgi:hypothetical protein